MPAEVVIYSADYCPFCRAAKQLLDQKGVAYEEISVERRPELRQWLVEVTGRRTVPQVFINGEPVGGFTDLADLDRQGKLDGLLAAQPPVDKPTLRS